MFNYPPGDPMTDDTLAQALESARHHLLFLEHQRDLAQAQVDLNQRAVDTKKEQVAELEDRLSRS